jgi:alkyl hydroperoxide reductase subunit D
VLVKALEPVLEKASGDAGVKAAKTAAAIMGMTNVYYRFTHFVGGEHGKMPAKLRMNTLRSHGGDAIEFEAASLAASAVKGCEMCVTSHEAVLRKHGMSQEGVQSLARIAASIHAVAVVLEQEGLGEEILAEAA